MIQFKQLIIDEAEVVDDEVEQQLKQLLTDDEDEVEVDVSIVLNADGTLTFSGDPFWIPEEAKKWTGIWVPEE